MKLREELPYLKVSFILPVSMVAGLLFGSFIADNLPTLQQFLDYYLPILLMGFPLYLATFILPRKSEAESEDD